jgi:hypothetical protein
MASPAPPASRTDTALRAAEDELACLRAFKALVAAFIHNPTHDPAARTALAQQLGLPEPHRTEAA